MPKLISPQEWMTKWEVGMLATPSIPCPRCGRPTRAEWKCQYCKAKWDDEEMEERRRSRRELVNQYPPEVLEKLEKSGIMRNSWLFG